MRTLSESTSISTQPSELKADPSLVVIPPDAVITPYDRGELTREAFLAPRPAIVVPILLGGLVIWYVISFVVAWRMSVSLGSYIQATDVGPTPYTSVGAASGPDLLRGEWWRLGTCGFVHIGLLHLLGNLFALTLLGPVAEGLWGRWRFLGLFIFAGLAAAAAAVALHPTVLVAGANGSVWGVQIAVVAWLIRYREHLPASTLSEWARRLVLVLGVSTVIGLTPGVCWESLVAGGIAGLVCAVLLDLTRPGSSFRRKLVGFGGLMFFVVGTLGGLVLTVHYGSDWEPLRKLPLTRPPDPDVSPQGTGISPGRVNALHKQATIAIISRGPSTRAATSERNATLAAEVTQAIARVPSTSSASRYLTEILRYTQLLQTLLTRDRLPTSEESQTLTDQRTLIERMWNADTPP